MDEPDKPRPINVPINLLQEKIIETIRTDPGSTLEEIASSLGRAKSTIKYHLNKLTAQRILHGRKEGKYIHFFRPDQVMHEGFKTRALLRDNRKAAILREVCMQRTVYSIRALANTLELKPKFVSRTVSSLEALGLVETELRGKITVIRANDDAEIMIKRLQEAQPED